MSDYEEETVEVFVCEVCRKEFKKEGSLKNHFGSKKHKKAEKELMRVDPERCEEILARIEEI